MNDPAHDKDYVVFQWGASSFFGWGIYGLNLMLNWAQRPDFGALCACPIDPASLLLNPVEMKIVEPALRGSAAVRKRLLACGSATWKWPNLALHGLGNGLTASPTDGVTVVGDPTIGIIFSESTLFDDDARSRARHYPLIVTGSTWNRQVLAAAGIDHVTTVIQGVDPTWYHPAARRDLFPGRFVVFSGGKAEHRKGQDLVVEAFRPFARSHPDALLLTAWGSPWPQLALSLNQNSALQPVRMTNNAIDFTQWTCDNGIPQDQVLHLGPVPHVHLPRIVREADIALFPNRAEGGTNLVAMECMASAIPVILSANTGHLDLIQEGNCYPLRRQKKIDAAGCDGWGESDVEEMVAALESAWADREQARRRGQRGAEFMSALTWQGQLGQLAEVLRPYVKHLPR